jgi:hypothetical protein
MTSTVQDSYSPVSLPLSLAFLGRFYSAIIFQRQRQADMRVAMYLRELPDDVLRRLGVSVHDMERLRQRPKHGNAPRPRAEYVSQPLAHFSVIGRVSTQRQAFADRKPRDVLSIAQVWTDGKI